MPSRAPVAWTFPLLTKITPAVGGIWLLARAQWRAAAVAVASTLVIVAVSWVLSPTAWSDWVTFLLASPGRTDLLLPRVVIAAGIVVFGARTNRAWVIPVAGWLALPVIWVNSWVILLAVIRLREPKWSLP